MNDDELKKLLGKIEPPEDDAAKTRALNEAVSAFEARQKKNEKNRQGNAEPSRLMNVIRQHIHNLKGDFTMKKAYIGLGTIAIGAVAISLLATTTLQRPDFLGEAQSTFSQVSNELTADGGKKELRQREEAIATPPAPPRAAPPPPPPPPRPMPKAELGIAATADMASPASPMASRSMIASESLPQPGYQDFGRDQYEDFKDNPVKLVSEEPVSTFSIDVDTASYSVVRKALNNGHLPPKDAVRVEEMINYFDYDYPVPESRDEPFKPTVALYETPWNADTMLMHVGIKGHELPADAEKPRSNLVFLLDVSGSMNSADKLPLLKNAFRMLVDTLQPDDTVAIVTYAGRAGTVLEPTKISEKAKILSALEHLNAGGSTAGAEGIRQAYALAEASFNKNGVNRVILATDGDFNVGITDREQLKDFVERKRDTGIYLSVLGFGTGNYNDAIMQKLAQNGNGNAAYIDNLNEARKVLVEEATSTLYPIANDVKIQVEFNPVTVAEYRLIGYETRLLNREDFNNDKVDAGDIGAGHTVTALYELTPTGSKARMIDDLRYAEAHEKAATAPEGDTDEFAFLKLRYKLPGESKSKLITRPITVADKTTVDGLSDDIRFAGAVAAFGQLLRHETYLGDFGFDDVLELALPARGEDRFGYRSEFIKLVRLAKTAQDQQAQPNGRRSAHPHR